jgi:hypothetical protein
VIEGAEIWVRRECLTYQQTLAAQLKGDKARHGAVGLSFIGEGCLTSACSRHADRGSCCCRFLFFGILLSRGDTAKPACD